jgi:hypothetical protein
VERQIRLIKKNINKNLEFLPGSLYILKIKCGKRNCKCITKGEKHKMYYLSYSKDGKTHMIYIPRKKLKEARELTKRYKEFKRAINKLKSFNIKLFKKKLHLCVRGTHRQKGGILKNE